MFPSEAQQGIKHEVFTPDSIRLDDGTRYRSMPAMVVPRAEDGLIDSSTNKVVINHSFEAMLFSFEHFIERIFIVFEPKIALCLNICEWIFT